VVPYDPGAPESVHLARYPAPDGSRRDPALEEAMDRALRITELGRAARTQAGIKVRQPLARLLVAGANGALDDEFLEVIRDEINVKRVEFTDPGALMDARLKPNFKALGPRFGGEVNRVAGAIKALDPAAVAAGLAGTSWLVAPEGMDPVRVGGEEVQVETTAREGLVAVEEGGLRVALDVRLDPALEREGRVRELVHRLQNLRKERGLAITDRVRVRVGAEGPLAQAVGEYKTFMQAELLADEVEIGAPVPGDEAWDVEGARVTVRLDSKQ